VKSESEQSTTTLQRSGETWVLLARRHALTHHKWTWFQRWFCDALERRKASIRSVLGCSSYPTLGFARRARVGLHVMTKTVSSTVSASPHMRARTPRPLSSQPVVVVCCMPHASLFFPRPPWKLAPGNKRNCRQVARQAIQGPYIRRQRCQISL
jgi:hypothetical protein